MKTKDIFPLVFMFILTLVPITSVIGIFRTKIPEFALIGYILSIMFFWNAMKDAFGKDIWNMRRR